MIGGGLLPGGPAKVRPFVGCASNLDVYVSVMDVELRLQRLGVPDSVYTVAREKNETYCLVEESDGWHVFYSERGNRNSERVFVSEAAASDELVRLVTNDGAIQPLIQTGTGTVHQRRSV